VRSSPAAPPPGPVADDVERIMSDPAFDYSPSWIERVTERITSWFGDLFTPSFAGPGATFGGGVGGVVAWALVVVALLVVVAVVVVAVRNRVRRVDREDDAATVDVEHRRPAAEWAGDAERFEREGRWAEAIRARYRELVRTLVDRRSLPDVAGLTTRELRVELERTTPDAGSDFDRACGVFESAWYRLEPVTSADLDELRAAAAGVLAAERRGAPAHLTEAVA
jgi:uncharacterized membrane protein